MTYFLLKITTHQSIYLSHYVHIYSFQIIHNTSISINVSLLLSIFLSLINLSIYLSIYDEPNYSKLVILLLFSINGIINGKILCIDNKISSVASKLMVLRIQGHISSLEILGLYNSSPFLNFYLIIFFYCTDDL